MAGVISLSNALGGVPVCVTNNVLDTGSHLKLAKGTTEIQGVQALEWLRSRDAFGSEIFREKAQHYFLSAMIRMLKANASLSHVTTLYSVADAATRSLTVSPNLGGVTNLLSLAQELGKVPTDRITMLVMPWLNYSGPDMADFSQAVQVYPAPAAAMFAALKSDQPYTAPSTSTAGSSGSSGSSASSGSGAPVASASAVGNSAAVNKAAMHVAIENASGVNGRAADLRTVLGAARVRLVQPGDGRHRQGLDERHDIRIVCRYGDGDEYRHELGRSVDRRGLLAARRLLRVERRQRHQLHERPEPRVVIAKSGGCHTMER